MGGTKIEWADRVWNPVTGCTPVSAGCDHCYARRMATRLRGRAGYPADNPFRVTCHPDRLEEPRHWRKPSRVFVCSMGDLFHTAVSVEVLRRVWDIMAQCPRHTFMVLTKRPDRMRNLLSASGHLRREHPLANVWLGVSVEDQRTADERIPILKQIAVPVRFVSVEPMLGPVNLGRLDRQPPYILDWIICGGETGPGARPMHPDWARSLRDQCVEAGVPFFFKSWGKWGPAAIRAKTQTPDRELDGRTWDEFPEVKDE